MAATRRHTSGTSAKSNRSSRREVPVHPAPVPPSPVRTSGQVTAADARPAPRQANSKSRDLQRDTAPPGRDMTTNQGVGVSDDENSLRSHSRGPTSGSVAGGHSP